MSAPVIRAVGTVASGTGTVTPGLPIGTEAGDLLLMFIENSGEVAAPTVSGWTQTLTEMRSAGTRLTILSKIAVGEDARTTSTAFNHNTAVIVGIKKGTFNATWLNAESVSNQASTKSVSITGLTTTVGNCLVLAAATGHLPDSNTSNAEFSAEANSSLESVTEQVDVTSAEGDGGALLVVSGVKATAGTVTATTATAATSAERGCGCIAISPGIATVEGKAALTGTGTLSAKGVRTRLGKAALTGTGTLAAKGTSGTPPKVTAESALSITETGTTLRVTYPSTPTTAYFEYGLTGSYGTKVEATKSKEALQATVALTGLTAATTYHYRAVLVNEWGTTNGPDQTFTTFGKPTITYSSPTGIGPGWATVHATINVNGGGIEIVEDGRPEEVMYVGVQWGTTTSYTNETGAIQVEGRDGYAFEHELNSLSSGVTYHYRIWAENAFGKTVGEDQTFTTTAKTVEGAAHLTGTGSLAAKGTRTRLGKAGLTGTGTLHATGIRVKLGNAALTGTGTLTAAGTVKSPETPPVVPVVRPDPRPNASLSIRVTTATGASYRWGPDEWSALNIPQSLTFGTAMPGGFDTLTVSLPRRIDRDYPDLNLLDSIEVLGPGNRIVWQGRIQQLPRSHQDTWSITVGAVGWSAHLMDDTSFREAYVDRELGGWAGPSSQRQIVLRGAGYAPVTASVTPDPTTQLPSLDLTVEGAWNGVIPICEPYYDAGPGLRVAYVYAEWIPNTGGGSWIFYALGADDTNLSNTHYSANLGTGAAGSGLLALPGGAQRVVGWQWYYANNVAGTPAAQYTEALRHLAVFGAHGLPLIGATAELGVAASAVVANVLQRAAPLLTTGEIEETTFAIPQLAFREATTAQAVIEKVNAYHLWEWGVYDDRKFFFREPNPDRLCWEARLSDGATLDLEGTQVADIYNGVIVQFSDATGESKTAGPIGSGCDYEDARLEDKSATNVVNQHGIPRKWAILGLSVTTTNVGAIQIGSIYLGEKSLPQRRGSMTITGWGWHPTAGPQPAWAIRAGDFIRVGDHPADEPRRIISTSYDHESQTITLSLDNASQKIDAIIEWLGVSQIGVL